MILLIKLRSFKFLKLSSWCGEYLQIEKSRAYCEHFVKCVKCNVKSLGRGEVLWYQATLWLAMAVIIYKLLLLSFCSNLNLMLGNHKITFRVAMHSHVSFCVDVKEKVVSCFWVWFIHRKLFLHIHVCN